MKKVVIAFVGLIVLLIIGIAVIMFLPASAGDQGSNPLSAAKTAATNAALDASGIKDKAAQTLRDSTPFIAKQTGLSEADVSQAISGLDIPSWKAATLPTGVQPEGTVEGTYGGVDGNLTLYDDPGFVTVTAYGQEVTLAVPESAQPYMSFIDAGVLNEYLASTQ